MIVGMIGLAFVAILVATMLGFIVTDDPAKTAILNKIFAVALILSLVFGAADPKGFNDAYVATMTWGF